MAAGSRTEEIIVPFPARSKELVPPATRFRSTWLTSSLRALRDRGRLDEYFSYLPREYHEQVRASVAGFWLPIDVAVAHYEAADRLGFTRNDLYEIGLDVHRHAQATVFSLIVKLAVGAGATPWTVFPQFQRLWDRVWVGGGLGVFKVGPKEARLELVGWPCSKSTYTRHAMRGIVGGALELFCSKAYITEIPRLCTSMTLGYRCAWA